MRSTPVATHGNLAADVDGAAAGTASEWHGAALVLLFPLVAFATGSAVVDVISVVDGRGGVVACFVDGAAVVVLMVVAAKLLRATARAGHRRPPTAAP